uniref:Uncharacterized protein n=1 Tax=Leersia perrieri TaxID=77586 RepID=A0A0D9V0S1_9ORYZ
MAKVLLEFRALLGRKMLLLKDSNTEDSRSKAIIIGSTVWMFFDDASVRSLPRDPTLPAELHVGCLQSSSSQLNYH